MKFPFPDTSVVNLTNCRVYVFIVSAIRTAALKKLLLTLRILRGVRVLIINSF